MIHILSLTAAVLPAVVYVIILRNADRYEKENYIHLIPAFFWGAFGATLFSIIFSGIFDVILSVVPINFDFFHTIVTAPVTEELFKGIYLFLIFRKKHFDNLTDGIVYGATVGLGFGMFENFLYFIMYQNDPSVWIWVVVIRSTFTIIMHSVASGVLGAYFGYGKLDTNNPYKIIIKGYIIAVIIHFSWNFSVSLFTGIFPYLVFAVGFRYAYKMFKSSLNTELKILQEEFYDEHVSYGYPMIDFRSKRLLGKHPDFFSSAVFSYYFKNAVLLAFRKHQEKYCREYEKVSIRNDIETLRNNINMVLNSNEQR